VIPRSPCAVTTALKKNEAFLAELIRQGQSDGSISSGIDAENTARVMVCLTQGLRVVGKSDARCRSRRPSSVSPSSCSDSPAQKTHTDFSHN
jgi:hypothetical protein